MTATSAQRPALEVADVIRQYGDAFLDRYGGVLSVTQRKALRDLAACRTAELGGHIEHCLDCGHDRIAYNSCRNRHCPKCQALARYTHRVAISNSRLLDLRDGRVTFRYQDYADAQQHKTMTLAAAEFLRRFMQHILPRSFVKIRHYGLLANAQRQVRLALCRRLLQVAHVEAALPGADTAKIEPAQPRCCPQCGGIRLIYRELDPVQPRSMSIAAAQDSS